MQNNKDHKILVGNAVNAASRVTSAYLASRFSPSGLSAAELTHSVATTFVGLTEPPKAPVAAVKPKRAYVRRKPSALAPIAAEDPTVMPTPEPATPT